MYLLGIFVSGVSPLFITLNEKSNFISQNYFLILICLTTAMSIFLLNRRKDGIVYFVVLLMPFLIYWFI